MSSLIDTETFLSENEQWKKLEKEWGKPIDLEVDAEDDSPRIKPVYSTLDLKGTTFDSSFLFKEVSRKITRQLSKKSTTSALEYYDFIRHLKENPNSESNSITEQFHCINGQIMTARSIENICNTIDDIFKSIDKLSSATSTIRKAKFPETIECSISATDFSFDDTEDNDLTRYSEMDRHIEEAFDDFETSEVDQPTLHDLETSEVDQPTLHNLETSEVDQPTLHDLETSEVDQPALHDLKTSEVDQPTLDSVTTLVRRFSSVLNDTAIRCSPRRQRMCCEKFKELAEFWKSRAFNSDK